MKSNRLCTLLFLFAAFVLRAESEPKREVFESPTPPVASTEIDRLVFQQLAALGLRPVLCSDAVFVRRVYLDVTGTLPTAQEARDFIQNPDSANKRRALIERLLTHDQFADYWAMKWADILRIKAEFPVNLWPNAAQAYHRWVRASLATNKPYDQFARELLTASGSNFRVGPANFYRAIQNRKPDGIAGAVALAFLGERADAWPAEKLAGMAAFFAQVGFKPTGEWKEEHVFWDPLGTSAAAGNTAPGRPAVANIGQPPAPAPAPAAAPAAPPPPPPTAGIFPDGTKVDFPSNRDPRELFADWLITPKNPWFARAISNRVWAWLVGRGIVHEPDDFRADNPPSNPALLAYLQAELVSHQFDLRHLYRLILNSATYQLSSVPRDTSPAAVAHFASYPLRRLDAEVLIDAINKITGTTDLYTSPIPEPFTYIPADMPAVAIADGSITSPFLALFGRSARATGFENERDNKPVPAQWLHLLNSSHIQRKLDESTKLRAIFDSGRGPARIIEDLYLTILSRLPSPDEVKALENIGQFQPARPPQAAAKGKQTPPAPTRPVVFKRREDWIDISWALFNSSEFVFRH
ncbi:MAG: DUF1553 domain-containing protein [Verrucomicrobia bacterium]|nr:DUF1553 domain-containing protein [Verrucomicrobiota bacterium]